MNILLADDHPFVHDVLKTLFNHVLDNELLVFFECLNCKDIFDVTEDLVIKNEVFDIVLLDFNMPVYPEQQIFSGSDAALYLKKAMPNCKIIILTASMESITVFDIVQVVKPNGFLFKSDLCMANFSPMLQDVLEDNIYRSSGIQEKCEEGWCVPILRDAYNRSILNYLSLGYKIKEISQEIALTEAAVHKRIAKMKEVLHVKEGEGLLKEVKKRGYV